MPQQPDNRRATPAPQSVAEPADVTAAQAQVDPASEVEKLRAENAALRAAVGVGGPSATTAAKGPRYPFEVRFAPGRDGQQVHRGDYVDESEAIRVAAIALGLNPSDHTATAVCLDPARAARIAGHAKASLAAYGMNREPAVAT